MKSQLLFTIFFTGVLFTSGARAQSIPYRQAGDSPVFTINHATELYNANLQTPGTDSGPFKTANALPVYPNPVISDTHIVLPITPRTIVYVDVIDLNGGVDRSYQYPTGSNLLDVDLSGLPASLYSVRVYNSELGFYNLKVVKD